MIKKLGFATVLSALLLSGCGGGAGSNNTSNTPTDTETAQQKLLGTWMDGSFLNGCDFSGNESYKTVLTFTENDLKSEDFEYNNTTCDPSGLTKDIITTFEYSIIGTDTSKASHIFYKTDFTKTGVTLKKGTITNTEELQTGQVTKTGFLFDGEHLVFAKEDETETIRSNDFNLSDYFTKQP